MYYSNGNYEAFARPRRPQGVDQKSAYLVGGGVASLAAAAFLIRDGQMDGRRITRESILTQHMGYVFLH
jgi:oleate hydratase